MSKYFENYEEYKESLLDNRVFMESFYENYKDTLRSIEDHIGKKGYIFLISALSFGAGFFLFFFSLIDEVSSSLDFLIKTLAFTAFLVCCFFSFFTYRRFIKNISEYVYYSYVEGSLISEQIQKDQTEDITTISANLRSNCFDLAWGIDTLKKENGLTNTVELLEKVSQKISTHEHTLSQIGDMAQYKKTLSTDFYFSKALYECVHNSDH